MIEKMKLALAATAVSVLAVGAAQAATCTVTGAAGPNSVTYTATQGDPDLLSVYKCQVGNDMNALVTDGWTLGAIIPDNDGDDASGQLSISLVGQMWEILNPFGYTEILLSFKQANSFGSFVVDTSADTNGLWGILGPGGSSNSYSHVSAWHKGEPSPIPLPAAGFLLMGALGGLGLVARRRKTAA